MNNIQVIFNDGIYLPALDLWLDAHLPQARVIVSHAHADHIGAYRHVIATPETAHILRHRMQSCVGTITPLPYGEPLDLPGPVHAQLTLYPAGHCLGSAQALIEIGKTRICYTGDMKPAPQRRGGNGDRRTVRRVDYRMHLR